MTIPSMSRCGFFCISSRSLKVPGSDSSALHTRYLSIAPLGRKDGLLAHLEAGAAAPAQARRLDLGDHRVGRHRQRRASDSYPPRRRYTSIVFSPGSSTSLNRSFMTAPRASVVGPTGRRGELLVLAAPGARALTLVDDHLGVRRLQRADVDAVDRGHRSDVARPEALERAHVEALVAAASCIAARVPWRRAASTRCSCTRRRRGAAGLGLEHVVEGRDRVQVGRGHPHHARRLVDRLRRAPAVVALHGAQSGERGRVAVRVLRHVALDLGAQLVGHRGGRGVGDGRRVLVEVDRLVPARNARAVLKARRTRVVGAHRSIPPNNGSSIANVAMRSAM